MFGLLLAKLIISGWLEGGSVIRSSTYWCCRRPTLFLAPTSGNYWVPVTPVPGDLTHTIGMNKMITLVLIFMSLAWVGGKNSRFVYTQNYVSCYTGSQLNCKVFQVDCSELFRLYSTSQASFLPVFPDTESCTAAKQRSLTIAPAPYRPGLCQHLRKEQNSTKLQLDPGQSLADVSGSVWGPSSYLLLKPYINKILASQMLKIMMKSRTWCPLGQVL